MWLTQIIYHSPKPQVPSGNPSPQLINTHALRGPAFNWLLFSSTIIHGPQIVLHPPTPSTR